MASENKQTLANKKWQEKNKERTKYLKARSASRSFIKNFSNIEDLKELEYLIDERKKELQRAD